MRLFVALSSENSSVFDFPLGNLSERSVKKCNKIVGHKNRAHNLC